METAKCSRRVTSNSNEKATHQVEISAEQEEKFIFYVIFYHLSCVMSALCEFKPHFEFSACICHTKWDFWRI